MGDGRVEKNNLNKSRQACFTIKRGRIDACSHRLYSSYRKKGIGKSFDLPFVAERTRFFGEKCLKIWF